MSFAHVKVAVLLLAAVATTANAVSGPEILPGLRAALGEKEAKVIEGRLGPIQEALRPIFVSMPHNEHGRMGRPVVRYVLHRFFMQRGWSVRGLEPAGQAWTEGSPTEMLKDEVPSQVVDLFEAKFNAEGLDLMEIAALAATFKGVVRAEMIERLRAAYRVHELQHGAALDEESTHRVLDTILASHVLGQNISAMSEWEVHAVETRAAKEYNNWEQIQQLARDTKRSMVGEGAASFPGLKRVIEEVGERFGPSENSECLVRKRDLLAMEHRGSGRVRLSDFYRANLHGGKWQFGESSGYLRQLGALDESNPDDLQVIIPNYVNSKSNCIDPSRYYSVCCLNECDALLGQLESSLGAPSATPSQIAPIVAAMPSATVPANRTLSASLLQRLQEVADGNDGRVPLHGRLFAQWMHHAYPRECPYPHEGGVNPQTPDEWMQEAGEEKEQQEARASKDEVRKILGDCATAGTDGTRCSEGKAAKEHRADLPWSDAEVLLASRPSQAGSTSRWSLVAKGFVLVALLAVARLHSAGAAPKTGPEDRVIFEDELQKPGRGAKPWMLLLALVIGGGLLECLGVLDRFSFGCTMAGGLLLNFVLPLMMQRNARAGLKLGKSI